MRYTLDDSSSTLLVCDEPRLALIARNHQRLAAEKRRGTRNSAEVMRIADAIQNRAMGNQVDVTAREHSRDTHVANCIVRSRHFADRDVATRTRRQITVDLVHVDEPASTDRPAARFQNKVVGMTSTSKN